MKVAFFIGFLILALSPLKAQDIFSVNPENMNTAYVDTVIAQYDTERLEHPEYQLKEAIHIAEGLTYHNGVKTGYNRLLNFYETLENVPLLLRSRLLLAQYLEEHQLTTALKTNYLAIGNIYFNYDLLEKAKTNYLRVDSIPAPFSQEETINLQKHLAITHYRLHELGEANYTLINLEDYGRSTGDWSTVFWARQQQAKIAHTHNDFNRELAINQATIALADSLNKPEVRAVAINNLAYTYKYLGDFEAAQTYFTSILSGKNKVKDAVVHQNLAILYQNNKDFQNAKEHFKKALDLYARAKDDYHEAYLLDFLALTYYQQGDFYNAQKQNDAAIRKSLKYKFGDIYQSSYYTQSLINQALFEYEDALHSMNRHLEIKDSLTTIKNEQQSAIALQQLFLDRTEEEVHLRLISEELKDLEIKRLQAEQSANEERLKRFQADIKRYETDSLYNVQRLITQGLRLKEVENMMAIQEQQNQIQLLDQQKKQQEMALKLEQIENQKKEESLLLEKKNNEVLALQLKERQAFVRNLIYFLSGLLLLIIIIIIFMLNLRAKKRQIERQQIQITAEKEKSESLLLNILPKSVADELKEKGKSPPRHFEMISIVFTDFSGFTKISENLTPVQLVEKLDQIFLEFDLIVEQNGLNRIKTIGDAYMCAAGIPDNDPAHAENAVKTALQMRNYIEKFNANLPKNEPQWNIRIGINSGPVVAGVVGIRKFAYDIWGDAVNIAARMESSGEINKVNISTATYELVKRQFTTEHRGKIYAKNKGEIDMYFIEQGAK